MDPCHLFAAPGFSWIACLKFTDVDLKLIRDPDISLIIESGIRGGVSTITHRYAKANNPYLSETYDKDKPHRVDQGKTPRFNFF